MELSGLLLPLGWVIGGGFWRTLLICLLICPIVPQLLGLIFCSYWAPWSPSNQFWAYIPGNPFLAVFIAGMSTTLDGHVRLPWWANVSALAGAAIAWAVLTLVMDRQAYRKDQLWSANKAYHNSLYFWYGYFAFVCYWAMWGTDASLTRKLLVTLAGLVWVSCLAADNLLSREALEHKLRRAHADNLPLWRTGFKLRKWNERTGRYELAA